MTIETLKKQLGKPDGVAFMSIHSPDSSLKKQRDQAEELLFSTQETLFIWIDNMHTKMQSDET